MKTFFTVFFAILAAAIVIFVALSAKARLDQWEQAKQACYAQIMSETKVTEARAAKETAETRSLAATAGNSNDVLEVGRRGLATVQMVAESLARIAEAKRTLVAILENKPFGLPLTADERKELDSAKADIQKNTEK